MDTSNGAGQTQNQTPNTPPSGQPSAGFLKQIEEEVGKVYSKITIHLPAGVKEFIVHYGPWIALVFMIFAIPGILLALGLTAVFAPMSMMYGYRGIHTGGLYFVSGILALASFILEAMALPALFKRQMSGWRLLFYSTLVTSLGSLISMDFGSLIIGTAISLYILFEIKSYYK